MFCGGDGIGGVGVHRRWMLDTLTNSTARRGQHLETPSPRFSAGWLTHLNLMSAT